MNEIQKLKIRVTNQENRIRYALQQGQANGHHAYEALKMLAETQRQLRDITGRLEQLFNLILALKRIVDEIDEARGSVPKWLVRRATKRLKSSLGRLDPLQEDLEKLRRSGK